MVKMTQDFAMRYPLVNGHGNFGSIDGDPSAAQRYTEAKLSQIATEMLKDLDKDTIKFVPNYDESLEEPSVLPAKYPNLLVNGSNGIAVGMATSIPPHNLGEVIDAVCEIIDNPSANLDDILKHIQAPDFPTGAYILNSESLYDAYKTGTGKVVQRAKTHIEENKNEKTSIVVTEIPYQVNKAKLVEKIAELVKEKKIEGISDIRDESNREGIRIVVELKRNTNPDIVLNQLFKHTSMQQSFSILMLALVNNQPKVLSLEQMLKLYLEHQIDVTTRRTNFDLHKAQSRVHLLEGLLVATNNIDNVIQIIRSSYDNASTELVSRYSLSEIQVKAVLDMQLKKLQGLEKDKLVQEKNQLETEIEKYQTLLLDENLLKSTIKDELLEIKEKYGDKRRTECIQTSDNIDIKDIVPDEDVNIILTHLGYIKRIPVDVYRSQNRGGKGVSSITTREEDFVEKLITTTNHSKLAFFTNKGRLYNADVFSIPETSKMSKGINIANILHLKEDEKITSVLSYKENQDVEDFVIMCTKNGLIKKTKLELLKSTNKTGVIAISLKDDDMLVSVDITDGTKDIFCITKNGQSMVFKETDVRDMGRSAQGVRAIKLGYKDEVVAMFPKDDNKDVLIISEKGYGKRTKTNEYTVKNRGGKGCRTYNIVNKTGNVIGAAMVSDDDEIMIINTDGTLIRTNASSVVVRSRITSGVKLMNTTKDIASFVKLELSTENLLENKEKEGIRSEG